MADDTSIKEPVVPASTKPSPQKHNPSKPLPPYHVVLLDDDQHTYVYVIDMLRALFAVSPERAYELAREVDAQGRVIVHTTHRELAELKRDQIHSWGADSAIASCQGSMAACIEPAR